MFKPLSALVFLLCSMFWMPHARPTPINFECFENMGIAAAKSSEIVEQESVLYEQTLEYLRKFLHLLQSDIKNCKTSSQVILTSYPATTTSCAMNHPELRAIIEQSHKILEYPDDFRSCFRLDASDSGKFTPSIALQELSDVANDVNRPLLSTYFEEEGFSHELKTAGKHLSQNFVSFISDIVEPEQYRSMSFLGLRDLWASVGWIPLYAERTENSLTPQFKGSYLYAEVIGPSGLLRIDSIENEPFNLELGMTVQAVGSFYPYHHHLPREIYIDISKNDCLAEEVYFLSNWDQVEFPELKVQSGAVIVMPASRDWENRFSKPEGGEIRYIDRNFVHSFYPKNNCANSKAKGLVSVWARTESTLSDQHTRVCELVNQEEASAKPASEYICYLRSETK